MVVHLEVSKESLGVYLKEMELLMLLIIVEKEIKEVRPIILVKKVEIVVLMLWEIHHSVIQD